METEYLNALNSYNSYVLYYSIFLLDPKNSEASARANAEYVKFMRTYDKKIYTGKTPVTVTVPKPAPPVTVPPVVAKKTVGDYYTFTKVLKE